MSDLIAVEEELAHLRRTVEEMSGVIARQDGEIALLQRRVALLMERAAEAEAQGGGSVFLGNERPPHY